METYEGMTQTDESQRPNMTEDRFTKSMEDYTSAIPSSAYLGMAVAAMVLSLFYQATGREKWGNFIAQWVPTWLIIGVYNKLVKLEGHDQAQRADMREQLGEYMCEFCDSKFSLREDLLNHQKHCSLRQTAS
ncbi:MAG TPA: hypothetical protein VFU31_08490 [Candidatus Binatia bacterium]|nr:hypothetical protein [Candidatus Binatia bacterium]